MLQVVVFSVLCLLSLPALGQTEPAEPAEATNAAPVSQDNPGLIQTPTAQELDESLPEGGSLTGK